MNLQGRLRAALAVCVLTGGFGMHASGQTVAPRADRSSTSRVRVVGSVVHQQNAIALPGVTIEVVGRSEVVHTDVDGRYLLELPEGHFELRAVMDGYQDRIVRVDTTGQRTLTVDLTLAMSAFAETVTVTADVLNAETSSASAQLVERKNAQVITDNIASQDMKANGDSDAAAAMQRVTGLSVVDNQYVFVRGLGERYSNTTLAGSVLPTTEPDKKVVPLDLFPTGLLDSVQVAKTYSPDKSAEFAGGLVQVIPVKIPNRPMLDLSYGLGWFEAATGKNIPFSPLGSRDWLGFDNGARALPDAFPAGKVVRSGIYTPDVGFSRDEITQFGRLLENRWTPGSQRARPGQSGNLAYGNRFGKLGVLASFAQSYKEQYVEENRRFYRVDDGGLEVVTDYDFRTGTQKAQIGAVANLAYQFTSNHRVGLENFYTHSGRDEGRSFEGPNTENNQYFRNTRLQFVEEGLLSNALTGDHFFQGWGNSRLDWRANWARASRDEPDLREVLYQSPLPLASNPTFLLADESQSGFRLFQELDDETVDVSVNWSFFTTVGGRPFFLKAGPSYVKRTRDFTSRRFRYVPTSAATSALLRQAPEQIYVSGNIGPVFRFNEDTRPVDAYDADQETTSFYGMVDTALSNRARLVAGVRVEDFSEKVNTFDPFGLFEGRVSASIQNTDVFPGVNLVYSLRSDMNIRVGYSQTTNRPEFRELAAFEFTDVVGNRAVRGNPALRRALIQNLDARWELFSGARGVVAASAFYKAFDDPIERVIIGSAQPLQTYQNADSARNVGIELEVSRQLGAHLFFSANYTWVDSEITLSEAARQTQTSQQRALAGQSTNLFNAMGEFSWRGLQARALVNFFDDRISDVGASGAPDIVEGGRTSVDVVVSQRVGRANVRLTLENLTDTDYLFTQGSEPQRSFNLGRTVLFSVGYSFF